MDEVIFEEFKGTGNSELHLDRRLVDRRIWPAIDISRSRHPQGRAAAGPEGAGAGLPPAPVLSDMNPVEAMELLQQPPGEGQDQRRVPDDDEPGLAK